MEQLHYFVSNPGILWTYILVISCAFILCLNIYSRRSFIATELIYGVCNPRPGCVEEVIAEELAHARVQEREIEKYRIRLSTLTYEEVTHQQELQRSAKCARERAERLKMYARYFKIKISDDRIEVLSMEKLRERADNL